jgi:hypothetical protein
MVPHVRVGTTSLRPGNFRVAPEKEFFNRIGRLQPFTYFTVAPRSSFEPLEARAAFIAKATCKVRATPLARSVLGELHTAFSSSTIK